MCSFSFYQISSSINYLQVRLTTLLHKFVVIIAGDTYLVLVFSNESTLSVKFTKPDKKLLMCKLFRSLLVSRALRLFDLAWLSFIKTVIILLIYSRNITSSISFSTSAAFKASLAKFEQNQ